MTTDNKKKFSLEHIIVIAVIVAVSALISGYLTFKVQFERRKAPPVKKTKEMSLQTLRIKEQERKQIHDHFHLLTDDPNLEAWAEKSSCIICHSPYPHGKNKKAIAIMNLHTEFMTCHSCHLKLEDDSTIRFGWITPDGRQTKGKPYGVSIDPDTGFFAETEDHISKLTPYRQDGTLWMPVTSENGIHRALDYMKNKDSLSDREKKEIENKLHQGTELKEFIQCSKCHSKNGVMNFRKLGFDAARANQLEKMEIGGMLTNYDVFYFPELFEKKFK